MPTRRPGLAPFSTTGMPEMPWRFISAKASASVAAGWMVTGFAFRRLRQLFLGLRAGRFTFEPARPGDLSSAWAWEPTAFSPAA